MTITHSSSLFYFIIIINRIKIEKNRKWNVKWKNMQIKNKNFGQTNKPTKFTYHRSDLNTGRFKLLLLQFFVFRSSSELQQNTIPDALFITIPAEFFFVSFILGTGIIFISFWFLVQVISLLWLQWSIQSPFHQTNILCWWWWWWSSFSFSFCFSFSFFGSRWICCLLVRY